jgi:hypothetical protein
MIVALVPRKTDDTVDFIRMIALVATGKYEAHCVENNRSFRFFVKQNDIMVQKPDEKCCEIGYFFNECDYIQDFTNLKYTMKKLTNWTHCSYRDAIKYYQNGFTVRAEIEDGVYEEYSKTKCELQDGWVVLDDALEYEWMEE